MVGVDNTVIPIISVMYPLHVLGQVTPVDWKKGQDVIIPPSVSDEEAKKKFGDFTVVDLPSGKKYLRYTSDPSSKNE